MKLSRALLRNRRSPLLIMIPMFPLLNMTLLGAGLLINLSIQVTFEYLEASMFRCRLNFPLWPVRKAPICVVVSLSSATDTIKF